MQESELRFIRRQPVQEMTGMSKSQLYELMAAGRFPQSVRLGGRGVAWELGEVQAWMRTKLKARESEGQS